MPLLCIPTDVDHTPKIRTLEFDLSFCRCIMDWASYVTRHGCMVVVFEKGCSGRLENSLCPCCSDSESLAKE